MKNISTILTGLLLVLVGILFYLHFSSRNSGNSKAGASKKDSNAVQAARIAYFDLDSIQNGCDFIKVTMDNMAKMEADINGELSGLEKKYRERIQYWQSRGANISQAETEQANQEVAGLQKKYNDRKAQLEQDFLSEREKKTSEINNNIKDYLKEFNSDKRYGFIFAYEPHYMYYADTVYNVTVELVKGLNARYPAKK